MPEPPQQTGVRASRSAREEEVATGQYSLLLQCKIWHCLEGYGKELIVLMNLAFKWRRNSVLSTEKINPLPTWQGNSYIHGGRALQDMGIEKISLSTGKSQEAPGMSGMTQDRPEKRAG